LTQIEDSIDHFKWQRHQVFILKTIQLFETFNVRFGVMLVGPTGAGKTTCYKVLEHTMTALKLKGSKDDRFQVVKKTIFNPKAITMGELYGEVNEISQEWHDGLASKMMRQAANESGDDKSWIVFDGPVDALWIENMNTVLDDNMTLCLANGQRIKLRHQMRILFEVQDLAVASPATVSRCGMVYLTYEELGWRPFVKTWLWTFFSDEILSDNLREFIYSNFDATIDIGLEKIRDSLFEPVKTADIQQVVSICNYLEVMLDPAFGFKGTDDQKKKLFICAFAWSYIWGMGASLDDAGKERFDDVIRD
jgi:dynein heavy chain, axonemal